MNKKQLIQRVQLHMGVGCTRESARAALQAVLESIVNLSKEESVTLRDFGCFSQKSSPARQGHHPLSNERLSIPAKEELHFSPSSKLLDS